MENGPDNKKITLPSSGLAEDILAAFSALPEEGPDAGGEAEDARPDQAAHEDCVWGEEGKKEEESHHLVGFFLNDEEYALDISLVQEIIRVGSWTRVPNAPGHIRGVINLRGRIIPVIDPKAVMELGGSELARDSRIMVIEAAGRVLGMLVDGVSQVIKLPTRLVEPPPDEVAEKDRGFIKGVGKLDSRLVILLDLEAVVGNRKAALR